jgi:hypothetical protein
MVEATRGMDQFRFCFVSNQELPTSIQQIEASHVEFMSEKEAQVKFHSVINGVVLHFGRSIKGAQIFPHYFVPLTDPIEDASLGFIKKWILKRAFSNAIKKSTATLCLNDWIYNILSKSYSEKRSQLSLTHLPLAAPIVYYWSIIAQTKEQFAGGNNYFLGLVNADKTISVLKEFSIFKKWQLTNMTLVLVYQNTMEMQKATDLLKGYKYRTDVYLYCYDDLTEELLAGAYAMFCQSALPGNSGFVELAMQHQVPVMLDTNMALPESWHSAGEHFNFNEKQVLSNHFKLYYKDEIFRQARSKIGNKWLEEMEKFKAAQYTKKLPLSL